ncbi:MAG: hypothetical protein ABIG44_05365 [Planctomycetota bacterium]
MAIEFHCDHCGKMIRAGDEHAGKRGQCPHCHNSVYIPTPSDQIEILDLAPLDQSDEERQRRLLDEGRDLAHNIMHDRDTGAVPEPPPARIADSDNLPIGDARLAKAMMEDLIIRYAQHMAQGDLTQAQELATEIRADLPLAEEVMQALMLDEIPPEQLASIPRPVLVGFFRQLREKK